MKLKFFFRENSKEDIKEILENKNVIYFYHDKEQKIFLIEWFLKAKDLIKFRERIDNNPKIIAIKGDIQS